VTVTKPAATKPAVYVAIRTADQPEPGVTSTRMICSACACKVWVGTLAYDALRLSHPTVRVLCEHCVAEAVA
jgi:hypothetical protein